MTTHKTKEGESPAAAMPLALPFDWKKYEHFLENSDLSDDDKRKLLEAMWSIIVGFVDLGFGIHPYQQACEQELKLGEFAPKDKGDVVTYPDTLPRNIILEASDSGKNAPGERNDS